MKNLIYLSAASHLFSNDELLAILNKSRDNNTSLGVTGILLYHEGSVLQILEGEEQAVDTVFNAIKRDTRHKGIIKMIDCAIAERSFSDWSMGFKIVSDEDWAKLSGYFDLNNSQISFSNASFKNDDVITMIQSFSSVNMLNMDFSI
jgi:hypothetical protein